MSKYNNSMLSSSHNKCNCGRKPTIAEWQAGIGLFGMYTCPDCLFRQYSKKLTTEEYYNQFKTL